MIYQDLVVGPSSTERPETTKARRSTKVTKIDERSGRQFSVGCVVLAPTAPLRANGRNTNL
jgi:hypothetical protein